MDRSADGSSISARTPSLASRPSAKGSPRSASPGSASTSAPGSIPGPSGGGLGRASLRALARRSDIRPTKALGQHFLADPNLARAIAADAGVGPGDHVLEIGAGLGSLTVALAETGCEVLALELDRALLPALREVVGARSNVRIVHADATSTDWPSFLDGEPWSVVANLPYNVSVPLVLRFLEHVPVVERLVVMVQREVAARFVARPAVEGYGPVSVRVALLASTEIVRRVPREVFWPRPNVDSVVIRVTRRSSPLDVDREAFVRVVEEAFAERRKTVSNALRRLGLDPAVVAGVAGAAGVEPGARPEEVSPDGFVALTRSALAVGWAP